jgi:hypothetical protein
MKKTEEVDGYFKAIADVNIIKDIEMTTKPLYSNTNFQVKKDERLILEAKNTHNYEKALLQAEKHYEDLKKVTLKELKYLIVLNASKVESDEMDNDIISEAQDLVNRSGMKLSVLIIKGKTFLGNNINNATSISKQLSECRSFGLKSYIEDNKEEVLNHIAKYFFKELGGAFKEKMENSGFSSIYFLIIAILDKIDKSD